MNTGLWVVLVNDVADGEGFSEFLRIVELHKVMEKERQDDSDMSTTNVSVAIADAIS